MAHISSLTAALLIGLSTTASGLGTPETESAEWSAESEQSISTQMMAINDAVEATKDDPSALCFVVALPENYQQARAIRDQWTIARKDFNQSDHQVFFVRGQDAQFVLESSFIQSTPATIAFRHGRPHHSRTGTFTEKNLHAFLALSFDNSTPTTNAPDQTEYLYDSMNQLAIAEQDAVAARGACSIMLNLHALIHGPYANSFSDTDLAEMTQLYNQTQLTLATLDTTNQSVLDQINHTRAMAIKTWNKRTNSTFGFGIWSDLAFVTGDTDSVLEWIDQGLANVNASRVEQTLADYGQPLAALLTNTHRYEALAMTLASTDQIKDSLDRASIIAQDIAAISGQESPSYASQLQSAADQAAHYHAALLLVGRESEAWQVAQLTEDFAGPQAASAAICAAAINAGALTDRHAFLVRNLDQSIHNSLIQAMNTSFAVVPTDD